MTIKRLDHISVVIDDLPAAISFFTTLGMTIEGKASVKGPWVDRINGLENVQADIVMMRTPDGHGRLELRNQRGRVFSRRPSQINTIAQLRSRNPASLQILQLQR